VSSSADAGWRPAGTDDVSGASSDLRPDRRADDQPAAGAGNVDGERSFEVSDGWMRGWGVVALWCGAAVLSSWVFGLVMGAMVWNAVLSEIPELGVRMPISKISGLFANSFLMLPVVVDGTVEFFGIPIGGAGEIVLPVMWPFVLVLSFLFVAARMGIRVSPADDSMSVVRVAVQVGLVFSVMLFVSALMASITIEIPLDAFELSVGFNGQQALLWGFGVGAAVAVIAAASRRMVSGSQTGAWLWVRLGAVGALSAILTVFAVIALLVAVSVGVQASKIDQVLGSGVGLSVREVEGLANSYAIFVGLVAVPALIVAQLALVHGGSILFAADTPDLGQIGLAVSLLSWPDLAELGAFGLAPAPAWLSLLVPLTATAVGGWVTFRFAESNELSAINRPGPIVVGFAAIYMLAIAGVARLGRFAVEGSTVVGLEGADFVVGLGIPLFGISVAAFVWGLAGGLLGYLLARLKVPAGLLAIVAVAFVALAAMGTLVTTEQSTASLEQLLQESVEGPDDPFTRVPEDRGLPFDLSDLFG